MLINIMDLLEAEVDKEIAQKKAAQDAPGFAETAENCTQGTQPAENINGTPDADRGAEC